jgi:hypothetical protein
MSITVNAPASPAPLPTNTVIPATEIAPTELPTQIPASPTSVPPTLVPNPTATVIQPSFEGTEVAVDPLHVVLFPGLASGARGLQFARAEGDLPAWEMSPQHIQLKLEGYAFQGTALEPQIYVYPALEYAQMVPAAFESMHRLNNIFYDPATALLDDGLPIVPFFNAQQVFASNIQLISFQNGKGIRFLSEYAQYPASANNHDLFYHFQGLSSDGEYYVIAILPIRAPVLAETSDAGAPLPPGGIPYPYMADPGADMQAYYKSVTDLLNATSPDTFTPMISQLDTLIQSIRIIP